MSQKYTLVEGTKDDIPALIHVAQEAFRRDTIWRVVIGNVSPEEEHAWLTAFYGKRYSMDDMTLYIVKNEDGKIVGYTALEWPWDIKHVPNEFKDMCNSPDPEHIPPPKGVRLDAWKEMFHLSVMTREYGYDPEKDFHRRSTMILPEAQKQGLGSLLTRRCNQVADEAGRKTWAGVRPSSIGMFRSLGFGEVKVVQTPVERWGGTEEMGKSWLLCREPQSKAGVMI
ncbi:GCN5-related N-acetyltransferase protein [Rutstroemia sp. NJR-2017a WRK4]|nr:GCN5-related N-acetyltransferase protein [Rutstroemia sp. NJR-2017a WRK4]